MNLKIRKMIAATRVAAVIAFSQQALSDQAQPPATPSPKVEVCNPSLKIRMQKEARSAFVISSRSLYEYSLVSAIYRPLYTYKQYAIPYEIRPAVAAELPHFSADRKIMTVKLRQDSYFHDDPCFPGGKGRRVTAHDFAYTLMLILDPRQGCTMADGWTGLIGIQPWITDPDLRSPPEGLRVVDDFTLRFVFENPVQYQAELLTMLVPTAREAHEKYGSSLATHSVGNGFYRLKRLDASKAVLQREVGRAPKEVFDIHREGFVEGRDPEDWKKLHGRTVPFNDVLEFHFVTIPSTARQALLKPPGADSLDMGMIEASELPGIADHRTGAWQVKSAYKKSSELIKVRSAAVHGMFLNVGSGSHIGNRTSPEVSRLHKLIRLALKRGFDSERYNRRFFHDSLNLHGIYGSSSLAGFSYDIAPTDPQYFAPDHAKETLLATGLKPHQLPEIRFGSVPGADQQHIFEFLKVGFGRIGYPTSKIKHRVYSSFPDFGRAIADGGEFEIAAIGTAADYNDLMSFLVTETKTSVCSRTHIQSHEYDRLYLRAISLRPGEKRDQVLHQMQQFLLDQVSYLYLGDYPIFYLRRKNICGKVHAGLVSDHFLYHTPV